MAADFRAYTERSSPYVAKRTPLCFSCSACHPFICTFTLFGLRLIFTKQMLITMNSSPTISFKVIDSCRINELQIMAINGIRNVYEPTLLASPEPTSVKNASHPKAMTKIEMKSKFDIKGNFHSILDQLSILEPTHNKKIPPMRSCT